MTSISQLIKSTKPKEINYFVLALVASAFLSGSAAASNWIFGGESEDLRNRVYYDTDSIRRDGQLVTAWVQWDFTEIKYLGNIPYRSSLYLLYLDCTKNISGNAQVVYFADNRAQGTIVHTTRLRAIREIQFEAHIPDSVGENLINSICRRIQSR